MKSDLKAKFLQHLASKKRDGGFTLIELLVVIIIIGILAAIALPSFLNQANKAKQSEAKTYVGSANRAQQAYFLENNQFAQAGQFSQLGLGVATSTTNYAYTIESSAAGVTPAVTRTYGSVSPTSTAPLKPYVGGVTVATTGAGVTQEATTLAVLCEATYPYGINSQARALTAADVTLNATEATCTGASRSVGR